MEATHLSLGELILAHYGWQGVALAATLVVLLALQLRYYLLLYGRIPGYRNNRRPQRLDTDPPISVIVPMFAEDSLFVEERLPLLLAQEYGRFEIVIVYVGSDKDFFEDLQRIHLTYPQIVATKIEQDNRFPISTKMALNVGIKSAHYEHLLFTTTDAQPLSSRWLALMAKGFQRGDIVVGYCGLERRPGLANRWMRTDRMMESVQWLARAVARRPYRGIRSNFGFTKTLYFEAKGFNHLNMNLGEDDLFLQKILRDDNLSVVLSPRAAVTQRTWGGWGWWTRQRRFYDSTRRFYPAAVRNFIRWEEGSRLLFLLTAATAIAVMPLEYKLAVVVLLLLRYAAVLSTVWRITRRVGEQGLRGSYLLYDLLSPLYEIWIVIFSALRRDDRVWR